MKECVCVCVGGVKTKKRKYVRLQNGKWCQKRRKDIAELKNNMALQVWSHVYPLMFRDKEELHQAK